MRIFVAGATGTMGRPLLRRLLSEGHQVTGLTRSPERARALKSIGVDAVVGDALDRDGLRAIVTAARPEQVVHLLTALPAAGVLRPKHLQPTNTLRTIGTANLLSAALDAGARRLIGESFFAVYGTERFSAPVGEDDPLPPVRPGPFKDGIMAMRSLEDQLRHVRSSGAIDTVSLRFGLLYGPDVPSIDAMIAQARAGRLFLPGKMDGMGAFVHIDDATSAIAATIAHPAPWFRYNIVDDRPAGFDEFMTRLAEAVGGPRPRRMPFWLLKLAAPMAAEAASSALWLSNAKAKAELSWHLRYPTIEDGLRALASQVKRAA